MLILFFVYIYAFKRRPTHLHRLILKPVYDERYAVHERKYCQGDERSQLHHHRKHQQSVIQKVFEQRLTRICKKPKQLIFF